MAAGGAADRVDHREALFQRVAAHDVQLRPEALGELFRMLFQRGGAHVLGRRVDEVAHGAHRLRFRPGAVDRLDLLGQQDARALRLVVFRIAVEAVLRGLPAVQCGARIAGIQAIGAGGKDFCQPGEAPARQRLRVGDAADGEPAIAIRHDGGFVTPAGEFLRIEGGTLAAAQALFPVAEARLVDEMDGNRVLVAIRLDEIGLVCHGFP